MDNPPSTSSSSKKLSSSSKSIAIRTTSSHRPKSTYDGNFGQYLSEQYSVLKLVLSYLNYYDLNNLREVNISFKKATDILLKQRSWIQCATLTYMQGTDHRPEPIHNNHFIDLRIEPKILFTVEAMPGGPSSRTRPKICMRLRDRNDNRFFPRSDIVPNSVKIFIPIGAKGIIFTEKNEKNENAIIHTMMFKKLALLYMPASNNYDITVFSRVVSTDSFSHEPIKLFFSRDPRPVRGLIFLKVGAPHSDSMIRFIVKLVANSQSESFALSGGHVSCLNYDFPPKRTACGILKAIIFRGDGIRCMSDFVGSTTNEGVLEELNVTAMHAREDIGELKPEKSFIMMFQCVDRHSMPMEDYKQMATIFPNIPIFGMLTWGEIGFRSFRSSQSSGKPKRKKFSIVHSVKTTFMIISLD